MGCLRPNYFQVLFCAHFFILTLYKIVAFIFAEKESPSENVVWNFWVKNGAVQLELLHSEALLKQVIAYFRAGRSFRRAFPSLCF
jgi:hypothetical protein